MVQAWLVEMKSFRFELELTNPEEMLSNEFRKLTREDKLQWHSSYKDLAEIVLSLTNHQNNRMIRVIEANNVLEASKQIDRDKYRIVSIINL